MVFVSHLLAAVPAYSAKVNGVVIATIGATTPNFAGNFWEVTLDQLGHLILPTIAIVLISLAPYTRYTRVVDAGGDERRTTSARPGPRA